MLGLHPGLSSNVAMDGQTPGLSPNDRSGASSPSRRRQEYTLPTALLALYPALATLSWSDVDEN